MSNQEDSGRGVGTKLINWALGYSVLPRLDNIKNKTIGLLNRLIQLAIIGYIIGYAIVYKQGYQSTDTVISSVATKMKGVSYANISNWPDLNVNDPTPYNRIWDVSDYVIPPQQSDTLFVMTNMIITPNQQRGQCPEDPCFTNVACNPGDPKDCIKGLHVMNGNGVRTGNCVPYHSPDGSTNYTCEVEAWCPVEYNVKPTKKTAILQDAKRFTVLIKNTATYSKFGFFKSNISENKSYISSCLYNSSLHQLCPMFRLGDIASEVGEDFNTLAYNGGVIAIKINWDCNLDYNWNNCTPNYSFSRIDNKAIWGYNFRFSHYYQDHNGTETRTLFKAYGILFKVIVTGTARKFDLVPLMLNIGSGMALLTIAKVTCDTIVKMHTLYENNKSLKVNIEEGETDPFQRVSESKM